MRLCKATLGEHLWRFIHHCERVHGFNRENGYEQVRGKPDAIKHIFGKYDLALDLVDTWTLEEPTR